MSEEYFEKDITITDKHMLYVIIGLLVVILALTILSISLAYQHDGLVFQVQNLTQHCLYIDPTIGGGQIGI